jgi:hypothetical protein
MAATDWVGILPPKRKGPVLYEDQPYSFNFTSPRRNQAFQDIFLQITSPLNPAPNRIKVSGPGTELLVVLAV